MSIEKDTRRRGPAAIAAVLGAALLALLPAMPAAAATHSNGDASLTVDPVANVIADGTTTDYMEGLAAGTVLVDGAGFDGNAYGLGFGVYLVYGPKEADYLYNSGWYLDAAWFGGAGVSFSDAPLEIAPSYEANPYHNDPANIVSCEYDYGLTEAQNAAAAQYKCYIQTFSAHGADNPIPGRDEVAIEVRW